MYFENKSTTNDINCNPFSLKSGYAEYSIHGSLDIYGFFLKDLKYTTKTIKNYIRAARKIHDKYCKIIWLQGSINKIGLIQTAKEVDIKSTHYLYFLAIISLLEISYKDYFYTNPKTIKKLTIWLDPYIESFQIDKLINKVYEIIRNTEKRNINIEKQKQTTIKVAIYLIIRYQLSTIYDLSDEQWKEFIYETRDEATNKVRNVNIKLLHNSLWEMQIINSPYSRNYYQLDKKKNRFINCSDDFKLLFNSFIDIIKKTKEDKTVRAYCNSLEYFYSYFYNLYDENFSLSDLTRSSIIRYIEDLQYTTKKNGERYSQSWSEEKVYVLKRFLIFVKHHKLEFENKGIEIYRNGVFNEKDFKMPRKFSRIPKKIEDNIFNLFLNTLSELDNKLYKLAFLLMAETGLAKIDLINLKYNCVVKESNYYVLEYYRIKTKSYKRIRVNDKVPYIIEELQKMNTQNRELKHPDKSYCIFLINDGGTHQNIRWFDYWFKKHIKLLQSKYSLNDVDNLTPHMIRHTYASKLREQGLSIYEINKLLGHKGINTTSAYIKEDDNKKVALMRKLENYYQIVNQEKKKNKNIDREDGYKANKFKNYTSEDKCITCEFLYSTPTELPELLENLKRQQLLHRQYKKELHFNVDIKMKEKIKEELKNINNIIKLITKKIEGLKTIQNGGQVSIFNPTTEKIKNEEKEVSNNANDYFEYY